MASAQKVAPNELDPGEKLIAPNQLRSDSGQFTLDMQKNGNLALHNQGAIIWSTGTQGNPGAYAVMQHDGNFVVRSASKTPLWSTESGGKENGLAHVILRDSGELLVYRPESFCGKAGGLKCAPAKVLWNSGTRGTPPRLFAPVWWHGTCDRVFNSSFYEGPTWDGQVSCGPGNVDRLENEYGSPLPNNNEWECVELAERWLHEGFNLPEITSTDGWQVVNHYWQWIKDWNQQHPKNHRPLRKFTPTNPGPISPGDVISFGNSAPGHTDVVTSSHVGRDGTGWITTLNQNWIGHVPTNLRIDVSNWNFAPDPSLPATGWLHWTGDGLGDRWHRCQETKMPADHPWFGLHSIGINCRGASEVANRWRDTNTSTPLEFSCTEGNGKIEGNGVECARTRLGTTAHIRYSLGT